MKKRIFIYFFILFSLCVPFYYSLFSYYRQQQFEKEISIDINNEFDLILALNKEMNINNDLCDNEKRNQYIRYSSSINAYKYVLLTENYIKNKNYKSFVLRLFDIYGRKYSLSDIYTGLASSNYEVVLNYEKLLDKKYSKWSEKSNIEKNCWQEFLKSREYTEFENEIIRECENPSYRWPKWPQDMNLDEVYREIIEIKKHDETSIINLIIHYNILDVNQIIVQQAYENYIKHKEERDYISALFDSRLIFNLWNTSKKLDSSIAATLNTILIYDNHYFISTTFSHNLLQEDIIKIIICALISSLVISFIIWKRNK